MSDLKINTLELILWISIGILNIIIGIANGGNVSLISFVCCWIILMVNLFIERGYL